MKVYDTASIRNVAVVGHGGSGKTSLVASLLFTAHTTDKLGSVAEGTAPTDFDPEEIERKVSMAVAAAYAEHKDSKINLVDAPGYGSFLGEAFAALRACDSALIAVHSLDGIGVQTEKMFDESDKQGLPAFFIVNHLDRERAEFERSVAEIGALTKGKAVPVALPINEGPKFEGVVCLLTQKAYRGKAGAVEIGDVPGDMAGAVAAAREKLIEVVAGADEALTELWLENGTLDEQQLSTGLRNAVLSRGVFPVLAASGTLGIGTTHVLDALVALAPNPSQRPPIKVKAEDGSESERGIDGPLVAQVIKTYIDPFAGRVSLFRVFSGHVTADMPAWNATTGQPEKLSGLALPKGSVKAAEKVSEVKAGDIALVTKLKETHTGNTLCADKAHAVTVVPIPFPLPVIAYAVHGEGKGDDEKIGEALKKLAEEDPTIRLDRDQRSHELMLSGLGADHVKTVCDKVGKRFGVKPQLQKPKVPYLETITKSASTMYRHKKQTGGAGQFAEVHMRVEPKPRGTGFEYASEIFGGSISRNFWPSIEKGVKSVMEHGAIAGYPLVDVKAVIFDGKEHPVDSKDIAFQVAGREVFKAAIKEAGAVVLEPIMQVTVTVPDEYMGDILGDLTKRRGKPLGSDNAGGKARIRALVPMAEMLEYSATLKSMTSDRGDYTMSLDHYEKLPADIQAKLMADYKPHETED